MYFLPVVCFILGLFFSIQGRRHHSDAMHGAGIAFMLASLGIALIVFFALKALQ